MSIKSILENWYWRRWHRKSLSHLTEIKNSLKSTERIIDRYKDCNCSTIKDSGIDCPIHSKIEEAIRTLGIEVKISNSHGRHWIAELYGTNVEGYSHDDAVLQILSVHGIDINNIEKPVEPKIRIMPESKQPPRPPKTVLKKEGKITKRKSK